MNLRPMILLLFALAAANACAAGNSPVVWKEPATGMTFVHIPKGCYQMGNRKAVVFREKFTGLPLSLHDTPFSDELPQHEVCVDAFWLGSHEVRNAEWARVMGGKPKRPDAPVANVSWQQAQAFVTRLGERSGGRNRYRLPTEAEWEYACRAGEESEITPSKGELSDRALYAVEPDGIRAETQPVGKLKANAFGLHDMLGNVWEWVQDGYRNNGYARHGLYNPVVPPVDGGRVIRGASYRSEPINVRCARRSHLDANQSMPVVGLRVVRVP